MYSRHDWEEICKVTHKFNPPVMFPILHLRDGNCIELKGVSSPEFASRCKDNGVTVIDDNF